ncbi:unnamed protein product [Cylindrotheca closterium]|uniref:CN hydrolase domain-containing protein n=1 Tax=Cylindrotheca closterium TaxID=2856 RepID=A0AAD2CLA9_9STRA|nr:unnamed protein product [Cylindrotheca closterium]
MRLATRPVALWFSAATTASAFLPTSLGLVHPSIGVVSRSRFGALKQKTSLRMSSSSTNSMKVALCQFHVTSDKEANHSTAKSYLEKAKAGGADLVVLPEIWNSPYATAAFPEYAETLPQVGDKESESSSTKLLLDAAKEHNVWIVGGSIPEVVKDDNGENKIYNTCLVLNPEGEVVAKHRKVHLFDIDVPGGITFFESETLSPGEGMTHFSTPFGEIGLGICYDIRFPEYAMLLRQKYNCVALIYPGAFNLTTGPAHWELLQRGRAVDNQCYVMMASPARTEDPKDENAKYPHYTAWGHSTVVSPWGEVISTIDEKEGIVFADLDLAKVEEMRAGIPIENQKREDMYSLKEL